MDVWEAVREAAAESDMSNSSISRSIGRSRQFVATVIGQHANTTLDNAALMLASCGYRLCAVKGKPPKGALVIDTSVKGKPYADILEEVRLMQDSE